ncbi:hypothetical protein [Streptomyces sp. NPDC046759]|uniref:hypothetical protein n=1 Tax=Streptomyces sp. NPDC046759 TaxID=3155019 RepID=UPI0033DCBD95
MIQHARTCLEVHSGSDPATIHNASGAALPPLLYPRAGLALARGLSGIPLLLSEIRHLDAAVVNLESYGGHEAVLCEGYGLIERLERLSEYAREARIVEGVLALDDPARRAPCPHCS